MKRLSGKTASRFAQLSFADRVIEGLHRWILWIWAGLTAASAGYAKMTKALPGVGWIDAIYFGLISGLLIALIMLGIVAIFRNIRPRVLPARDRERFVDEVVALADLVGGQEPIVSYKTFVRCHITGPGQVKFHSGNVPILVSVEPGGLVELPEGSNIKGATIFLFCRFDRCHFDGGIIGTSDDMLALGQKIAEMTADEWKAARWGPT